MSVLYGDEGIRHRLVDSTPKVLVTDAANADRFDASLVDELLVLDEGLLDGRPTDHIAEDTSADDPAQLYYTSGTTGMAKGIVHAHRYILAHEEFVYCHDVRDGERFHGMGEWAWAAGISPLLGPWRLGATQYVYQREGGFDPHKQLDFLSRHEVANVFTTPTAMRAMMAVEDAGERYPQRFRIVCSAGEPLNPEAIRWFREQYGITVLDYYGLTESYPLCANYPFMEVREGSMGRPMPGWDVRILDEDENPVEQGERGEICLRARSNPHYPLGYWNLPEASEETFGGEWFHTKDAAERGRRRLLLVRRPRRRRDHRRRLPDRPVRGRVGLHRASRRPRGGGGRLARRGQGQRRQGVHRPRRGPRAVRRARRGDQALRPRPAQRLRLPAPGRVHRRAAEDAHRQDPPDRAPRGGAGARRQLIAASAPAPRVRAQMAPDAPAGDRPRYARDDSEFDRAIGFIDATFALALTLLITTLEVPGDATAWESLGSLDDALGAQFVAFSIAFVVISGYWLRHHRMVASFSAIDYPVIILNLGLVAAIVLLPFSTQAVGDPGIDDLALPTALMAANIAAASILHAAVYRLALHRGLISPQPSTAEANQYLLAGLSAAGVFLLSIPVAYILSPAWGRAFWLALIPLGYVLGRRARRIEAAREQA